MTAQFRNRFLLEPICSPHSRMSSFSDPKRAVAYLNLGDTLVKLHRNADARQAYKTYLEFAPSSKSAAEAKKKLEALH